MTMLPLPLNTRVFGEWLAALGILRVADVLSPRSALHFDAHGSAILTTAATETQIVERVIGSANPRAVRLRLLSETDSPSHSSVRIGDGVFSVAEVTLGDVEVSKNADATAGCSIQLDSLDGLEVTHFLGQAMSECAKLRSPLKMWAGRLTFPMILRQLVDAVGKRAPGESLSALIAHTERLTKRLRFDHLHEQFVEDGGHDTSEGRDTRPTVEWLGLIGLSFFPPEAGDTALLAARGRLRAALWCNPLTSLGVLLALHSGRFPEAPTFGIASDGKLKKIRPAVTHPEALTTP